MVATKLTETPSELLLTSTGTDSVAPNTVAASNLNNNWSAYVIVGIVAIGCYVNSINGEFVHDDIPAITLNRDVLGSNRIIETFNNDFWGMPMADVNSHKSYRPLTVLTFR